MERLRGVQEQPGLQGLCLAVSLSMEREKVLHPPIQKAPLFPFPHGLPISSCPSLSLKNPALCAMIIIIKKTKLKRKAAEGLEGRGAGARQAT